MILNRAETYNFSSIGNGFKIENSRELINGRRVLYKNKEIGLEWCNYYSAKTSDGFIAIEYGDKGSNVNFPKGIRIWNNITNTWTEIDILWISGMIGWVEQEK